MYVFTCTHRNQAICRTVQIKTTEVDSINAVQRTMPSAISPSLSCSQYAGRIFFLALYVGHFFAKSFLSSDFLIATLFARMLFLMQFYQSSSTFSIQHMHLSVSQGSTLIKLVFFSLTIHKLFRSWLHVCLSLSGDGFLMLVVACIPFHLKFINNKFIYFTIFYKAREEEMLM